MDGLNSRQTNCKTWLSLFFSQSIK